MEFAIEMFNLESEREEVLGLQELPEHGGAASPQVLGLMSFVSIFSDCTTSTIIIPDAR